MLMKSSSELEQAVSERLQYQPDLTHIAGHPYQSPFQSFVYAKQQAAKLCDPLTAQSKAMGRIDASTFEAIAASAASAASRHMSSLLGYAPIPTGEQPESLGSSPGSTSPRVLQPSFPRGIHGMGGAPSDAQSMAGRMRSELERAVAAAAAEPGEARLPSSFAGLARTAFSESRCATPLTAPVSASSSCLSLVALAEGSGGKLRCMPDQSAAAAEAPLDQLRHPPPSPSLAPSPRVSGWASASRATQPSHMRLLSNAGVPAPCQLPVDGHLRPVSTTPAASVAPLTPLTEVPAALSPLMEPDFTPLPPRMAALPSPKQSDDTCPDGAGAPWAMARAESTSPTARDPPPLLPPSASQTSQQITVLSSGPGGGALPRIADLRTGCSDGLLLLSSTACVLSRVAPLDQPTAKRQKV